MELKRLKPKSRLDSFRYAFKGVATLFGGEPNMWIHLAAAVIVIAGAAWCGFSTTEWIILTFTIGMVIAAEAFNSAIEKLSDYASKGERHTLIGRAKDLAAAGVLISAITAAVIGVLLFFPYFTA